MAISASLSRKEMLQKRMELVKSARDMIARAEASGDGQLRGEDHKHWAEIDKDIEDLTQRLETTPQDEYRQKLAAWDKDMDKNPGRITVPTSPGSSPSLSGGEGREILWRGKPMDFGGDPKVLASLNSPEYDRSFSSYLRNGGNPEKLGMQISNDAKGGVLASMGFVSQMIKFLDDAVQMRQLGTVIPTNGAVGMGAVSWDTDPGDSDWTPEVPATAITEDDSIRLGNRELLPHGFSKLIKMSKKLRRHHPMLESFAVSRLGYKAAVTEEKAYFTGDGAQKPLGVFTASDQGISTAYDIESGTSLTVTFDDFINAFYSLKTPYAARASWMVTRYLLRVARKVKASGSGEYLWEPSPKDGSPSTILGRPYNVSEFMPGQTSASWTAGTYVAAIGDWSYYWIVDSLQLTLQILEELLALQQQVGFLMTKETDGQPVLGEAFRRIALKA